MTLTVTLTLELDLDGVKMNQHAWLVFCENKKMSVLVSILLALSPHTLSWFSQRLKQRSAIHMVTVT